MPHTNGFNHVATLTTDMDLTVGFYQQVFGAEVTFEVARTDDHPWMKIVDIDGPHLLAQCRPAEVARAIAHFTNA